MYRYLLVTLLLLPACRTDQKGTAQSAEPTRYCYRTVFPADGPPGRQDVTELSWEVAGDGRVSGIYNWLPAEKDSRKGTFTGQMASEPIDGFVVHATYTYQQEGTQTEEKINIIVRENQAIVLPEGEFVWVNGVAYPRTYTLNDTLRKVDCAEIQSVTGSPLNE